MARALNLLDPEFENNVRKLLKLCEKDGFPMKPFFTLRSVYEQAKLYRQSRPFSEIQGAHDYLMGQGATFLASVLLEVGACSGKWATNALPGFSWHQHGKAVDCFWELDGKAEWSSSKIENGENGYNVYARNAQKLGMNAGHFWSHKDSVHVQQGTSSINKTIQSGVMTFKELDSMMKQTFDV